MFSHEEKKTLIKKSQGKSTEVVHLAPRLSHEDKETFIKSTGQVHRGSASSYLSWNGLRHGWATMETKILRGRWNPSQQNTLLVGVPPLEWPPTWLGHDGDEDHSWTMGSLLTKYPAGRGSTAGMASDMVGPRWKRRSFVGDGILPTKHPAGRGSTAGMASDMVGPRWKRGSFVDDGIHPIL